jgi:hypothetical protein
MERIRWVFIVLVISGATASAWGSGVMMLENPRGEDESGAYPVSRFGEAPHDPVHGLSADRVSENGLEVHAANRAPAGLVFDDSDAAINDGVPNREMASATLPQKGGPRTDASISDDTTSNAAIAASTAAQPTIRRTKQPPVVQQDPSEGTPASLVPRNSRGIQEVALIAGDLGFFPKVFFVSRDVPVRLFVTGASKKTLCIMMDSFQVRRQVASQRIEEITFTPSVPGQYRFYCPMNGMEGTMVVKEFASN